MLSADLLSLHLVTFLMFFSLVYVTLFAAGACLGWNFHLSHSSKTSHFTGFVSRCMQYGRRMTTQASVQALSQHGLPRLPCLHAHGHISNSVNLSNGYASLLCTLVCKWRKWHHKWSHSSLVIGFKRLVSHEKARGLCTARCRRVLQFWTSLFKGKCILAVCRLSDSVFVQQGSTFLITPYIVMGVVLYQWGYS